MEALILIGGGAFLIVGGLSSYTFATRYSDRPPPLMWQDSPQWFAVVVGATMLVLGALAFNAVRKR